MIKRKLIAGLVAGVALALPGIAAADNDYVFAAPFWKQLESTHANPAAQSAGITVEKTDYRLVDGYSA